MCIKELRVAAGLTQGQLAELVGVSQPAVTYWESGESIPSLANLRAMAGLFGCTLDELTREPPVPVAAEAAS